MAIFLSLVVVFFLYVIRYTYLWLDPGHVMDDGECHAPWSFLTGRQLPVEWVD